MLMCVSFSLTNQIWNYFEFCLCKTYSVFECLKGEWLKILILGKLGFKTCVLESISSHSHAFLLLMFNALRCIFKNQVLFLKRCFSRFSNNPIWFSINWNPFEKILWASVWFDWLNLFFDQSNIVNQVF